MEVTLRGVITARNKLGWDIFESIFAIVERVFVVMRFVSEKRREISRIIINLFKVKAISDFLKSFKNKS